MDGEVEDLVSGSEFISYFTRLAFEYMKYVRLLSLAPRIIKYDKSLLESSIYCLFRLRNSPSETSNWLSRLTEEMAVILKTVLFQSVAHIFPELPDGMRSPGFPALIWRPLFRASLISSHCARVGQTVHVNTASLAGLAVTSEDEWLRGRARPFPCLLT